MGKLPVWVGVPLSTPAVDSDKPVGKTPLFKLNVAPPAAPVCVKVWLNAVFTVPVAVTGLVTVIVWQLITKV